MRNTPWGKEFFLFFSIRLIDLYSHGNNDNSIRMNSSFKLNRTWHVRWFFRCFTIINPLKKIFKVHQFTFGWAWTFRNNGHALPRIQFGLVAIKKHICICTCVYIYITTIISSVCRFRIGSRGLLFRHLETSVLGVDYFICWSSV